MGGVGHLGEDDKEMLCVLAVCVEIKYPPLGFFGVCLGDQDSKS